MDDFVRTVMNDACTDTRIQTISWTTMNGSEPKRANPNPDTNGTNYVLTEEGEGVCAGHFALSSCARAVADLSSQMAGHAQSQQLAFSHYRCYTRLQESPLRAVL